jgi:hypothetical protein
MRTPEIYKKKEKAAWDKKCICNEEKERRSTFIRSYETKLDNVKENAF